MVLVDTSVWVAHLRHGNARLAQLLEEGEALCHPAVVVELACGHLRNRARNSQPAATPLAGSHTHRARTVVIH